MEFPLILDHAGSSAQATALLVWLENWKRIPCVFRPQRVFFNSQHPSNSADAVGVPELKQLRLLSPDVQPANCFVNMADEFDDVRDDKKCGWYIWLVDLISGEGQLYTDQLMQVYVETMFVQYVADCALHIHKHLQQKKNFEHV